VTAHVEIEPRTVAQEDVAAAAPGDDSAEQIPGNLVRRQPTLPPKRTGHPVLVLQTEDPSIHQFTSLASILTSAAAHRPFQRPARQVLDEVATVVDVPDTMPLNMPLNRLLARASTAFTSEYEQRLALAGYDDISFAATGILRCLGDDATPVTTLVKQSGVTKQAISQQIAHLVARGYLFVDSEPRDGRAKQVRLTEKGRRCRDVAGALHERVELDWRRRFGRDEINRLRADLEHITDRLAAGG
jgi:DNA-binding MarR family transcriptional regulator